MRSEDTRARLIIAWAASRPVLLKWLATIAADDADGLACTLTSLLTPDGDPYARAFLHATGACPGRAAALGEQLGAHAPSFTDTVNWSYVARSLISLHATECDVICARPHMTKER